MLVRKSKYLAIAAMLALGVSGCAQHKAKTGDYDSHMASKRAATSMKVSQASKFSGSDAYSNQQKEMMAKRVYRFGFDRFDVSSNDLEAINAHAQFLADHPNRRIRIEGHTDERGSREYNVALGERRAKAVQQLFLARGASPHQVNIVSFGEEKPESFVHDETGYSLNRRAVIVYEE